MSSSCLWSLRLRQPEKGVGVSATLGGVTAVSLQSVGAITLFVEDPQRSKSFYERVFGLPAAYEYEDAAGFKLENRSSTC